MCGIYEVSLKTIEFETGIKKDRILKAIDSLSKARKVFYIDGFIVVKNFMKHQQMNPKVTVGIQRSLNLLPEGLRQKLGLEEGQNDSLYIDYDSLSHFNSNFNLNSNSNLTKKEEKKLKESFEDFWLVYPKRIAKKKACGLWLKISPSKELTEKIVSAVEKARKTAGWLQDGGKYIPHPTTYLNQERWMDQVEERKIKSVNLK